MFETCDYRNSRYQGEMMDNLPHGIGIAFDYNHLFCLAEWRSGHIHGAAFVVFPDSRIFCGRISNGKLEGLCTFYMQDRIQMFANYSEKSALRRNFVAVLPFCKVILEIDHSQEKPKACRHQTYTSQEQSLSNKLNSIFETRVNLTEFKTWKDFLLINFVKAYPKKLSWKQSIVLQMEEVFLGLKHEGLGIKMNIYHNEKQKTVSEGDFFAISQMGSFSNLRELRGLGKILLEHSQNKMQQQGLYSEKVTELIQYPKKARPIAGKKIFIHTLRSSIYFSNFFLDLKLLYSLQKDYSNINVELVVQTQKIAQIIIESSKDTVILAEIENKKERKVTPQKEQPNVESEYQRVKDIEQNRGRKPSNSDLNQQTSNIAITANPQTRKSIYSSVQKKKRNYRNSPQQTRANIYEYSRAPQHTLKDQDKYQKPSWNKETSPYTKEYKQTPAYPLNNRSNSKKYLYQTILDNPNSLKNYLNTKSQRHLPIYSDINHIPDRNPISKQKYVPDLNNNYSPEGTIRKPYHQRSSNNVNEYHLPKQHYRPETVHQQSPPLFGRHQKQHKPSKSSKSKQDLDLINFFNNKIEEQSPSLSQLNKGVIYDHSKNHDWTLRSTPKKQKTPGKIVTYKKRRDPDRILQ